MPSADANETSPSRERWVAALTIAILVLVPVLAGRILGPGWPHPLLPAEPATVDESATDAVSAVETAIVDQSEAHDPDAPWRFETAGEVWSQPLIRDGRILFGSDDGSGYAIGTDGRELWRNDVGGKLRGRVAAKEALVVWASDDGSIVAAEAGSGKTLWRASVPATLTDAAQVGRQTVIGTRSGLTALDSETGRLMWTAEVGAVTARPAADGRRVVAGTTGGKLVAVDARSGRVAWSFDAGAEISTSPTVGRRLVLLTADDGSVFCLDAATGRVRWRAGTSEFVGSSPAVAGGRVFVGGGDGALWAFDLDSGLSLWRRSLAEPVRGTPFLHQDTLWMAAGERYLAAVRAADGEPLHVFAVSGWVSASPIVVAPEGGPDRLVFPTSDGSVHGVPLRLISEDLAPRPPTDRPKARPARVVVEPTFHDGRPELLWQTALPGHPTAAPALATGHLVSGVGRHLVALDVTSGEELWRATEPAAFSGAPIVAGHRVLAPRRADAGGRGALVAVDLENGKLLWRSEVDDDVTSRPTIWRQRAILGTAEGRLIALRLDDGSVVWDRPTEGAMAGAAVAGGHSFGIVVAGGCDGTVYGVSAEDGRELWRFRANTCIATDVSIAEASGQEVAYIADSGGTVYALDPAVGGELWRADLSGGAGRRLTIQGGTLYLGSHDGQLWSLSALHGGTRWRFDARGAVSGGVAVDLGIAYAASNDGALHAVGAINGQEFWRLETPEPAYDVTFGEARVYVVTASAGRGRIYALAVP